MAKPHLDDAYNTYKVFNSAYFEGKLPEVEIRFTQNLRAGRGKGHPAFGATSKKEDGSFLIELDPEMPPVLQKLTLAHEMAHVKLWPKSHTSKAWRAEIARLGSLGFLVEVF